ncbi:NLP/P60 family lipoprotein [Candidatus Rhodobacter oscarellae]|uniref:NLP/P60 family lipoprotein n=1 Tax=Candidatus Rhodobacter oscarellae TaxID=1675527 RepID=A0A0J9E8C4_9RHOB|nr:NlpC/P60 family protein [Candidatus Rhodobacter lobularis]KMW58982.1 NLP/P60 family lipoprotein [Candidatus Rhodobacter lobularis]
MDPRTTPANGRVAASHLRGLVEAEHFTDGVPRQVAVPVVDLLRAPGGPRDRQLVQGDAVTVYDELEGMRFVQAAKDGYVGYLPAEALAGPAQATHWVGALAGHAYTEPDIKAPQAHPLYFGAQLQTVSHMPKFYETAQGTYVPKPHLRPLERRFSDPVTVAQLFFGAPYLWGGNTVAGIDCSGLVQAACLGCGIDCPGDSDLQENAFPEAGGDLARGDALFWKGHVAIAVDEQTLIHANAHHMAVAYEPAEQAIHRIEAQGDGPVTSRRRLVAP